MSTPSRSRVFVASTVLLGAAVCSYAMSDLAKGQIPVEWLPLLALTAGAGLITLRVPGMPVSFSISDTFTIMATLVVGPSAGALTAAVDGLVLSYGIPRRARTPDRVSFNVACLALATWTAGCAYHALAPGAQAIDGVPGALQMLGALAVFGALHFALNSGLVAAAVAFERGLAFTAVWKDHFRDLWISSFGGTFAGMLMIALGRQNVVEALILVAPLPIVLHVALRHALGRAEDRIEHLGKMNKVYVATIEALAQAVDAKDQVTHDHVRRVQEKSLRLAERLGVTDSAQLQALHAAGLLHDVGKIGIPEHILNKPGRLTAPEFEIMKRHPAIGAEILSVIGFPYPLIPIVRHHHENWDGTGYPDGLAGEQIPVGARILQVVDCFDALTSDRPYRAAMSDADALRIVADRRGTMYDPRVVDALLELQRCEPPAAAEPKAATAGHVHATAPPPPPPAVDVAHVAGAIAAFESALGRHGSPALVGDALWTRLRAQVPASAIVLFLCDGQELLATYRAGERTLAPNTRIVVGQRVSGWVAASGRAAVNSDARLDFDGDLREQTLLRSTLAVPVRRDGETIGVLSLYAEQEDAFSDADAAIASAAAVAAARALTNPIEEGAAVAV